MRAKAALLFVFFVSGLVLVARAQYALQVGEQFIPIANKDILSKQALLSDDTIRMVHIAPGKQTISVMNEVMVVISENGGEAKAYMFPSGVFSTELLEELKRMTNGVIFIGQYRTEKNTKKAVGIRLVLGP
jgi:hypothetical protein